MKLIIAWTIIWIILLWYSLMLVLIGIHKVKTWRDWYEEALMVCASLGVIAVIIWAIYTVSTQY